MKSLRNRRLTLAAVAMAIVSLCSCRDEAAHTRIAKLEAASALQIARDQKVAEQISLIAKKVFNELEEKYTAIDPNGQGYATVASDNGTFLVSCKDVEAHLDGHKLILNIGNPYFMTYLGFTLRVKFGTRPPEYPKDATTEEFTEWRMKNDEWQKTLKQKELSYTDKLTEGEWSKVEMVLAPSKPEEIGYVGISIKTNTVSLRTPKE